MQHRRDCKVRQRVPRQYRRDLIAVAGGFEDRLCQLFDKQRDTISALDDLIDNVARETGLTGKVLYQRRAVLLAETF